MDNKPSPSRPDPGRRNSLPLDEDFEATAWPGVEWTTVNPNGDFTWQDRHSTRLNTSNKAAMVPIFGTNSLSYKDGLVSAP
jgi:hypothetical protein